MNFLKGIFGSGTGKNMDGFQSIVDKINALEENYKELDLGLFSAKTKELHKRLADGESKDDILTNAFALVREASVRTLGQRHFDVQLIGGIALHRGKIAEMKTGEGKTLVSTLPIYLNALDKRGVHVVTVNDYLARRDAVWMGQIFQALGMSVGCIAGEGSFLYDPLHTEKKETDEVAVGDHLNTQNKNNKNKGNDNSALSERLDKVRDELGYFKVVHEFLRPCTRREAYMADITYGTNSEFGFDYLRDNTAIDNRELRQRGHHFAVVDEIDSILIDEARTPLIISMPAQESEDFYFQFAKIASILKIEEDYTVDEKFHSIALTDNGIEKAEKSLGIDNIYTDAGIKYAHHLETAVRAKALYTRDKEYVVKDGEIIIVDDFTGRLQPGRRWSEGLHQAVEAKEGVKVQRESRTAASITYQNYFRMYEKLSGMTGTASTSSEEFYKVYGLDVAEVPTNRPIVRDDHNDLIFQTEKGKFQAIARRVKELNQTGQPVLIGTVSIEKNELLSAYLRKEGIQHTVLNAKNHEHEGEILAQAGRKGAVTVATNMAGRGVDIKLGGAEASDEQYKAVKELGGLFVLATERHEARRIDNQLRGRSGRQGDPGASQFFVSLEDTLMRVFASETIKKMMGRLGIAEDQPIENRMITKQLESAQTRIEGLNFDSRKRVLEYDDVLNRQRHAIYGERLKILTGSDNDVQDLMQEILGNGEHELLIGKKKQELGEVEFINALRRLMLQTIDYFWMQHLEVMDYIRGSVNLRAYGQRDPLVEYKKEGIRLFREMREAIAGHILELISRMVTGAFIRGVDEAKKEQLRIRLGAGDALSALHQTSTPALPQQGTISASQNTSKSERIGRNDPCLCGSGKKYKKCHGAGG